MRIGYIEGPDETAKAGQRFLTIYSKGCNLRCGYCAYASLLGSCEGPDSHDWEYAEAYIEDHLENLDGVVFSGGEPGLQDDLMERMQAVRARGLKVHMETNGTVPEILRELLARQLVDFVAMDVKAPLENYLSVVGCRIDTELIRTSIWVIKQSGIAHEFRTTVVPGLHTAKELKLIAELVHGSQCYVVQDFISEQPLRTELRGRPAFPHKPLEEIRPFVERRVGRYEIRHSAQAKPMPAVRRRTRTVAIGA